MYSFLTGIVVNQMSLVDRCLANKGSDKKTQVMNKQRNKKGKQNNEVKSLCSNGVTALN